MRVAARDISKEKLLSELKAVLASAEDFVQEASSQSGETLGAARARMESILKKARERVEDAEDALAATAKEAVESTERSIKDHPWSAVSVSAGIGLLIGILIGRR